MKQLSTLDLLTEMKQRQAEIAAAMRAIEEAHLLSSAKIEGMIRPLYDRLGDVEAAMESLEVLKASRDGRKRPERETRTEADRGAA